jgi:hypothetical protein
MRRTAEVPKLVRLYVVNVAIGFALALGFVTALVWLDVANLRHLILETDKGYLAFALLVLSNGIVFAGAQFAIAVMRLAAPDDRPSGGRPAPRIVMEPVRVTAGARTRAAPHR